MAPWKPQSLPNGWKVLIHFTPFFTPCTISHKLWIEDEGALNQKCRCVTRMQYCWMNNDQPRKVIPNCAAKKLSKFFNHAFWKDPSEKTFEYSIHVSKRHRYDCHISFYISYVIHGSKKRWWNQYIMILQKAYILGGIYTDPNHKLSI